MSGDHLIIFALSPRCAQSQLMRKRARLLICHDARAVTMLICLPPLIFYAAAARHHFCAAMRRRFLCHYRGAYTTPPTDFSPLLICDILHQAGGYAAYIDASSLSPRPRPEKTLFKTDDARLCRRSRQTRSAFALPVTRCSTMPCRPRMPHAMSSAPFSY